LIPSGSFIARRVLELAALRDPEVPDAARGLAAIVLAGDDVQLAQKVAEGRPMGDRACRGARRALVEQRSR
jgi:hypothetical protein